MDHALFISCNCVISGTSRGWALRRVLGIAGLIVSIIPHQATFLFAISAAAVAGAIVGGAIVYLSKVSVEREAKRARDNPRYFSAPWSVEERGSEFRRQGRDWTTLSHCHFETGLARLGIGSGLLRMRPDASRSVSNLPKVLSNSADLVTSIKSIRDVTEQSFGSVALPAREHFETLTEECDAIASMIRRSTADPVTRRQIVEELSKALEQLGADRLLLSIVSSIGGNIRDEDVLTMLQGWNARSEAANASAYRPKSTDRAL